MKRKIFFLSIILLFAIVLFYDSKKHHHANYYVEAKVLDKKEPNPTSKIDLEIKLKTEMLAQALSIKIPKQHQLKHIKVSKDTWLNAKITRKDNLKISVKNNALLIEFGIKIKGDIKYKKYFLQAKSKFNLDATVLALVDVDINKEWNLQTKSIDVAIKMRRAITSLYGLKIKIKSILQKEIRKKIPMLNAIIKKEINAISLKEQMTRIWKEMHLTKQIKKEDIWFHFHPSDIIFSKAYESNNTLCLYPCIIGKAMILTDKKRLQKESPLPLPLLEKNRTKENKFQIKLPIVINYKKLSNELMKKAFRKKIGINGFKIKVEEIEFIPFYHEMIIIIHFHSHFAFDFLNTKGTLIFKGRPKYNIKTHQLMIENLDYHLDMNERAISIASMLWHDTFKKEIEDLLVHEISQSHTFIHHYKDIINEKLSTIEVNKEILLNGNLETLVLEDIHLNPLDITIVLKMLGEMNVSYEPHVEFLNKKSQ